MARRKLQGQVAIVTGGGRGIGAATAEALASAGAAVVVTARSEDQVEAVASRLRAAGARAIGVPADVADLEQVEEVVEAALDQFSRVDILVNNAAVIWPLEEVAECDPDEWAYSINVNLVGPFNLSRNVLPVMLEQRYGRIVNISSGAATLPIAGWSAYCAAKAGLDMFTRVLAVETAGSGVTTNCLYPGMVDTEMQSDIRSVDTSETKMDFSRWHQAHEQGELLAPGQVAEAVLWLAGPWSRGHSGEIFTVNDAAWLARIKSDLGT